MKFWIEEFHGKFDLCYRDHDGVTAIAETFNTWKAACGALSTANEPECEDFYNAQYAHACGYHN